MTQAGAGENLSPGQCLQPGRALLQHLGERGAPLMTRAGADRLAGLRAGAPWRPRGAERMAGRRVRAQAASHLVSGARWAEGRLGGGRSSLGTLPLTCSNAVCASCCSPSVCNSFQEPLDASYRVFAESSVAVWGAGRSPSSQAVFQRLHIGGLHLLSPKIDARHHF